jgi:hypothetical protein
MIPTELAHFSKNKEGREAGMRRAKRAEKRGWRRFDASENRCEIRESDSWCGDSRFFEFPPLTVAVN